MLYIRHSGGLYIIFMENLWYLEKIVSLNVRDFEGFGFDFEESMGVLILILGGSGGVKL